MEKDNSVIVASRSNFRNKKHIKNGKYEGV